MNVFVQISTVTLISTHLVIHGQTCRRIIVYAIMLQTIGQPYRIVFIRCSAFMLEIYVKQNINVSQKQSNPNNQSRASRLRHFLNQSSGAFQIKHEYVTAEYIRNQVLPSTQPSWCCVCYGFTRLMLSRHFPFTGLYGSPATIGTDTLHLQISTNFIDRRHQTIFAPRVIKQWLIQGVPFNIKGEGVLSNMHICTRGADCLADSSPTACGAGELPKHGGCKK